ncbi:MAG: Glycosyl transferase [Candidatus Roizmanbacteria bacterium GW2011_GWC2_37_13]|uniref:Glycosyl transferase n=1 Tax=Candidatus Roizmanbacteria bacterium GW2011_GWC2_37_13 TaxID=1618486 RepID=A0A0G0IRD7_9BACT|nr:MAG: Glycosyl transferase, family 2 [Candidatus Roizmanbacteria bacterium GW2011_GWC1_37_12]KKQ26729.1 MAG: Glycosyl transferase [Candidatus Roizmanbacteria bacterium GW2011_GWC2_37_13]
MISIIVPFYNEKENLPVLVDLLVKQLKNKEYEIVLVDDGSTDDFISNIKNQISKTHIKYQKEIIKLINHKKRLGKGQALKTGIENSTGEIIIFMDGDLQDDPKDLPRLIEKIEEGYDFVNGIRKKREDNPLVKFYSRMAKNFLQTFLHSPYTDINCGFKAFRREVIKDFVFYGNNFRFFPLYVFYNGNKVTEIEVRNNPRKFGKSKFGTGKLITGIFDTLTAYFLYQFAERPLHFFGSIGGIIFFIGFLISFYLTIERLFFGVLLVTRPLLWLGLLLIIVGIQILMTGIIGELIVYLSKKK